MSATPTPSTSSHTTSLAVPTVNVWRRRFALLLMQAIGWTMFAAIAALTSLNDDLRAGFDPDYLPIFFEWSYRAMAMAIISLVIWGAFSRWPLVYASGKNLVIGFFLLMLGLLPLQLLFVVKDLLLNRDLMMSWDALSQQITVINRLASLLQITSVAAIYLAIAAIKLWQQNQDRRQRWEQDRADMLALKLELEQQRMLALRSQLEPHFMFNALNAISALVMQNNRDTALDGINGLSELLRYALTAAEKNWVTFDEEMQFVEDYLQLQKLRYGDRLQFQCEGLTPEIRQLNCSPLILQPLIENAVRHDLDTHQGASDIRLLLHIDKGCLHIHISNPINEPTPEGNQNQPNPGAGLGLRNTRARLQMAYGGDAQLNTSITEQRFHVFVQLPTDTPID